MRQLLAQLQVETLVLDLKQPVQTRLELDGYPSQQPDDCTLEVQVDKERGLTGLFSQLSGQGVEVVSLRNKSNRLEELFVSLVENGPQGEQG